MSRFAAASMAGAVVLLMTSLGSGLHQHFGRKIVASVSDAIWLFYFGAGGFICHGGSAGDLEILASKYKATMIVGASGPSETRADKRPRDAAGERSPLGGSSSTHATTRGP